MAVDSVEEITVEDAWRRLTSDPASVLIDVRTQAEWSYVGIPDLATLGKRPLLAEWQSFPGGQVVPDFAAALHEALSAAGAGPSTPLLFICRSGVRSLSAAWAMTAAGYANCANVTEGFEGPLDQQRHRGRVAGWKAKGLPWIQG